MNIMKYNIFDETKEEKIEKDIRTKESLDIIEDIDIYKFKNYTEINKDSIVQSIKNLQPCQWMFYLKGEK